MTPSIFGSVLSAFVIGAGGSFTVGMLFSGGKVNVAGLIGVGFAGGKNGKAGAGLVVIAAQVGEVDVNRVDLRRGGLCQSAQARQGSIDRRRIRQPGARRGEHFVGGTVQRRQRHEGIAPGVRQSRGQLGDGRYVLVSKRREQLAVGAVAVSC